MRLRVRPDLQLSSRWWHRLLIVLFWLALVATAGAVTAWFGGPMADMVEPHQRVVLTDLLSFIDSFDSGGDPMVAFDHQPGWLAVGRSTAHRRWFEFSLALVEGEVRCRPGGGVDDVTVIGTLVPMPNRPGEVGDPATSRCWAPPGSADVPASEVIKYMPPRTVVVRAWLRSALAGVAAAAIMGFAFIGVYSALLYVVFGAERISR